VVYFQCLAKQINSFQPPEEHDLPVMRPTYAVRILFKTVWYPPRPLPEHPSVLISKETARNKACQTRHIRYINWPEIYMNPNDTILTPNKKYKRTCKWTEMCVQSKNEKDTQTDTEYIIEIANIVRHRKNTNTVYHVPSFPQLNLDHEGCAESQISVDTEKRRMAQILGHINQSTSIPSGCPRADDVSLRGTPSAMQALRHQVQNAMSTIKDRLIDIAHASHHLDYLKQAATSGKLPGGMKAEPKMMLWNAGDETIQEWKEQTKINTLGYMEVARRHHQKLLTRAQYNKP